MENRYDVIIIGGGPVAAALAIELGSHAINTLVLEKHPQPLRSPRAQSLTPRTMDFMARWGIDSRLRSQSLFSDDYPLKGVWCSQLNGETFAAVATHEQLDLSQVAQPGLRIPLWITEHTLRQRLKDFSSVKFVVHQQVEDVVLAETDVIVKARDTQTGAVKQYPGHFVVGCDGANSITRRCLGIDFQGLAKKRPVLNVLFKSTQLADNMTVEKGILYYLLAHQSPCAIGVVDITAGLWYAQIINPNLPREIEAIDFPKLLNTLAGVDFDVDVVDAHFWDMQVQVAEHFSVQNRVFLCGDSAHAFAPTGGFGLNTGFIGAVNLAWKLSAVLKKTATTNLLASYEQEHRSVCLRNLEVAEKNAKDAAEVRQAFPPEKDMHAFVKANTQIARRHMSSAGLMLGYAYFNSPLTLLQAQQSTQPMPVKHYTPTPEPGYYLPHRIDKGQSIYSRLSMTRWTLIVSGVTMPFTIPDIDIVLLPKATYPYPFMLIRPDWHIAAVASDRSELTHALSKIRAALNR